MKYIKYFKENLTFSSDDQIQEEFRKDIPEKMYDIWDIYLDFSDDFTQNLRFFVVYGGGRFIIPIYMSNDFNLDISNSFENLDDENKRKLIGVIFTDVSNNLRYPVEFLIKWENPFEKCDEKMTELSEIIRLRGIDIKLNRPKNKYGRNDLFIEVGTSINESTNYEIEPDEEILEIFESLDLELDIRGINCGYHWRPNCPYINISLTPNNNIIEVFKEISNKFKLCKSITGYEYASSNIRILKRESDQYPTGMCFEISEKISESDLDDGDAIGWISKTDLPNMNSEYLDINFFNKWNWVDQISIMFKV